MLIIAVGRLLEVIVMPAKAGIQEFLVGAHLCVRLLWADTQVSPVFTGVTGKTNTEIEKCPIVFSLCAP